jgi:very-short-patch-repair endonuclease
LIERLGPDAMLEHGIKCGDAYAFQGDERDVMFLSMVAAPAPQGHRLPAQVNRPIQQRFNVAASRAKDQAWLFHSVTQNDLNPECLRSRLLVHFLRPPADQHALDIGEVRDDERHAKFDSLFEQRVYLRLRDLGYDVVPQWEVLGYRIDLVVLGETTKLAVECDGDAWHTAEDYDRDTARQHDLERCGWTFVRIAESDFYLDPDTSINVAVEAATRLGIRPQVVAGEAELAAVPKVPAVPPVPAVPAAKAVPTAQVVTTLFGSVAATIEESAYSTSPRTLSEPEREVVWPLPSLEPPESPPEAKLSYDDTLGLDQFGAPGAGAPKGLHPYLAWRPHPLPSPRQPDAAVRAVIIEIVTAEGPMLGRRLYALYASGLGERQLSHQQRSVINQAVYGLIEGHRLALETRRGGLTMGDWTIHTAGTPAVIVRSRGPRGVLEIPPSEIAATPDATGLSGATTDETARALLSLYGVPAAVPQEVAHVARALMAASVTRLVAPAASDLKQAAALPALAPLTSRPSRSQRDFDRALDEAVNEALGLGMSGLGRMNAAWRNTEELQTTRAELVQRINQFGVPDDLMAITVRVRDKMPNQEPGTRGAVVDLVIARYLEHVIEPDVAALLLDPWREATSAREMVETAPARTCTHGKPWGRCLWTACPGHWLGGVQTTDQ